MVKEERKTIVMQHKPSPEFEYKYEFWVTEKYEPVIGVVKLLSQNEEEALQHLKEFSKYSSHDLERFLDFGIKCIESGEIIKKIIP